MSIVTNLLNASKSTAQVLRQNTSRFVLWLVLLVWLAFGFLQSLYMLGRMFSIIGDSNNSAKGMIIIVTLLLVGLNLALVVGVLYVSNWARWFLGILMLLSLFGSIINFALSAAAFLIFSAVHKYYHAHKQTAPTPPVTSVPPTA